MVITKTNKKFLKKWNVLIRFSHYFSWDQKTKTEVWKKKESHIEIQYIENWLKENTKNSWTRIGNIFYFDRKSDAASVKLLFEENIQAIEIYEGQD